MTSEGSGKNISAVIDVVGHVETFTTSTISISYSPPKVHFSGKTVFPRDGNFTLELYGTNMYGQNTQVTIGGSVATIKYRGHNKLVVITPSLSPGDKTVEININSVMSNSAYSIRYFSLERIVPNFGNKDSSTILSLSGAGLQSTGVNNQLTSLFNTSSNAEGGGNTFALSVHSDTTASTVAPALNFDQYPFTVYPYFSLNGEDYTTASSNKEFFYYETPILDKVFPMSSPIFGETLLIFATFFNTSYVRMKLNVDVDRALCENCIGPACSACNVACGV